MTRKQKEFNAFLILNYVSKEHRFNSLRQFRSYANKNKLPDYLSIGRAFFEMESYDLEGIYIYYANRSIEQEIKIEWGNDQDRYSKHPKIKSIDRQESGCFRIDIHYLSLEATA